MVIVDTCVWSVFLRRTRDAQESVCAEVRRLIRTDSDFDAFAKVLPVRLHPLRARK